MTDHAREGNELLDKVRAGACLCECEHCRDFDLSRHEAAIEIQDALSAAEQRGRVAALREGHAKIEGLRSTKWSPIGPLYMAGWMAGWSACVTAALRVLDEHGGEG